MLCPDYCGFVKRETDLTFAHFSFVSLSSNMSHLGTSKSYKYFCKPGQPPLVDDQGKLATCTRFALSKAICFGFDKNIWGNTQSLDLEQKAVTNVLLNEHKDDKGKWPTDFDGKVYQFQESKYFMSRYL